VKPLLWRGTSLDDVRSFPADARADIGCQLYKVQVGLEPSDSKAMPSVGQGAREIRVHTENEYRVIYVAKLKEAVYVLHAFAKKTSKTSKAELELARQQLHMLVRGRRES
jgi:phage-related protein